MIHTETAATLTKEIIAEWFMGLQDRICHALTTTDGTGVFREDSWQRPAGGGGRSRIMEGGRIIEKGGVNFSAVHGAMPEKILQALALPKADFYATGVSIVMHPVNPYTPIIHMNVRYFEMSNGTYWFGGGIDLTPHYVDREQARFFHTRLKAVCDQSSPDYYPAFKKWADDYFFLQHRQETRGVGGIFFDRLSANEQHSKTDIFHFVQQVGEAFAPIYTKLMQETFTLPYGPGEREWQLLRRSRYVEFNLVWDKGTRFGLDTEGRTESILMSMPPDARWVYNHQPAPNSPEEQTLQLLKKGIDWVAG